MQENEKNNGMAQQPTPAVPTAAQPVANAQAQPVANAAPQAAQPVANAAPPQPGQPAAGAEGAPAQPGEQATNQTVQAGKSIQEMMGNINPGNPFKSAAHGASFLAGVLKNDTSAFQIQKATGDELLKQLNQVQNESNEYKSQADSMDKERVQKALNQKMVSFKYKVKDSSGKVIVNTFEAPTANDVKVFLKNEGYEVLEVTERSKYDIDINMATKINNGDLSFMLTQLSTYLKAGIPLINSVRILAKQTTNAMHKKVLNKSQNTLLI